MSTTMKNYVPHDLGGVKERQLQAKQKSMSFKQANFSMGNEKNQFTNLSVEMNSPEKASKTKLTMVTSNGNENMVTFGSSLRI